MKYVIYSHTEQLYWNNSDGWVNFDDATLYNYEPVNSGLALYQPEVMPVEFNVTEPAWNNDKLQFARLIAECMANGVFTNEIVRKLCDEMDLTPDQLFELVGRAQDHWDNNK